MKINLGSIEVTDEARRAFRKRQGKDGLATREELKTFIVNEGCAGLDVACDEGRQDTCPACDGWGRCDTERGGGWVTCSACHGTGEAP